jgi:hypothetical protein
MVAIITKKLKKLFIQDLLDQYNAENIGDSNNYYYIGLSKSQPYNVEIGGTNTVYDPDPSDWDERSFRMSLQSVKLAEAVSFVVPIETWSTNTKYFQYADNLQQDPRFYVRTNDNNVYVCIRHGKNAVGTHVESTVKPDHTDTTLPIESDGYVWKYLYTITTTDANNYLTDTWMPVKYVDSAAATAPEAPQKAVQDAAIAGQIIGYRVVANQAGAAAQYSQAPSLTVVGNGSGATARPIMSATSGNATIVAVEVGDSANAGATGYGSLSTYMGSNYKYANVAIDNTYLVSGAAPTIYPVFAQDSGMGADPTVDLKTRAIMFNVKPTGAQNSKFVIDQNYKQIGLIKNPRQYGSNNLFTNAEGLGLKKLRISPKPAGADGDPSTGYALTFSDNTLINQTTGTNAGAKAYLTWYDDSDTLWYHQDEYTGFTPFDSGETVTIDGNNDLSTTSIFGIYNTDTLPSGAGANGYTSFNPDIDNYSGEVLFINNQPATTRNRLGTEDIKLVIQL